MFYRHLPSYRPAPVYADLLEWHRQVRIGSGNFVRCFSPEEFALVTYRAELAGALQVIPVAVQAVVEQKIAELLAGFRPLSADGTEDENELDGVEAEHERHYREQFVELTRLFGPKAANGIMEYVLARLAWEADPGTVSRQALENYADGLPDLLTDILRMLDFQEELPNRFLELPPDR